MSGFSLSRWATHLCASNWLLRRPFTRSMLKRLAARIHECEQGHRGEIRLAIEPSFHLSTLLAGLNARQRAEELFSLLGVWDTEENTGILIYLLLAEKRIEIVADRGIHRCVGQPVWQTVCTQMEKAFAAGELEQGLQAGIAAISNILVQHFPASEHTNDELPDTPVIL